MEPKHIYNYNKPIGENYTALDVFVLGWEPAFDDQDGIELQGIYFTIIRNGKYDDWAVVSVIRSEKLEWEIKIDQYIESDIEAEFDAVIKEHENVLTDAWADVLATANEEN